MGHVLLSKLEKIYPASRKNPAFRAVKSIDLEIRDGEFMVLVGPSGCGKSTTLRMIAGLEEVSSGSIAIDATEVNHLAPKDRGIAMVFQNYALYPHMTVQENMSFGLRLAKTPKAEITRRVNDAAQILGLETLLDRKPAALSGGQRQRVAVGRAIVRQPQVFLFDEPLSNLDAKMRVSMRTEISKLHTRLRTTMIYVTHDQIEAMTMGDRICVMNDGEIQQVADPLTLYHQPETAYVAGFIGSPPMNLLRGRIELQQTTPVFVESGPTDQDPNGVSIPLTGPIAARAAPYVGQKIIFGIRPENFSFVPSAHHPPLRCHVELTEPMGAETYLHVRTAHHALIARLAAEHALPTDRDQTLHLDLTRAHLFDAVTERAIRS